MDAANRSRQMLLNLRDEVISGLEEDRQQIKTKWDEFTQYMDRFL